MLDIKEFVRLANQFSKGKLISDEAYTYVRNNKITYSGLQVKVSYGAGGASAVPWIGFFGYGQRTQEGIYPVFLYYREHGVLILAYGVSASNPPKFMWPARKHLQMIEHHLQNKKIDYGNSYVFKSYEANLDLLDNVGIQKDLDELIAYYHSIFKMEFLESPSLSEVNQVKSTAKNSSIERRYFKWAAGPMASKWNTFKTEGIAALSFDGIGFHDISQLNTLEELNQAAGLPTDSPSNQTWNIWLFKTANIGDIIFANKGTNVCMGIGIIEGDYYWDQQADSYKHRRKVNWITDKVYQNKPGSNHYKRLFRIDTFSPTKVSKFLLNEYVRIYPELRDVFNSYGLDYATDGLLEIKAEAIDEDHDAIDANYWWLNANPNIWSISDAMMGGRQTYTARNEKGNKRRIYRYFEEVQTGDIVLGYESSPVKQIKALFEITKPLHNNEEGLEVIEFELIEKLEIPIHWNDIQHEPNLQQAEMLINNQGSLFKLTEEEFDILRDLIDNKNILQERKLLNSEATPYRFEEDIDRPFVSAAAFYHIIAVLTRKKNIILQGPPGVGKTFIAKKLAYQVMGYVNPAQVEVVQFHQSYAYEDFVQGIRPSRQGFELKNGIFYSFCQQALAHPDRPFFFIIDEINRGNLSKIFGELLMLIEGDKRGKKHAIKLAYAEGEDDRFYVPENLYIIGTMNTADRSLAVLDYALLRRFASIGLEPSYDDSFKTFLSEQGLSSQLIEHICKAINSVNGKIKTDINLGQSFQIGHSYFCTFQDDLNERQWWNDVITFEVKPFLEQIWFDDMNKVEDALAILNY